MKIKVEDFIRAWQTSESTAEVVRNFPGATVKAASVRAVTLRKKGVKLKHMKTTRHHDYAALNEFAEQCLKEK